MSHKAIYPVYIKRILERMSTRDMAKYPTIQEMEKKFPEASWISPTMRNYKLMCCDCGLVHRMDFKVVDGGKRVLFRVRRDNRATGQARRWRNK